MWSKPSKIDNQLVLPHKDKCIMSMWMQNITNSDVNTLAETMGKDNLSSTIITNPTPNKGKGISVALNSTNNVQDFNK